VDAIDHRESVAIETITKDTVVKDELQIPERQSQIKRETFATFGDFPSEDTDTQLYQSNFSFNKKIND